MSTQGMNITVIIWRGEDGYWVSSIPEIPGALSQGKTKAEAKANVISAMHELMAVRREMAQEEAPTDADVESVWITA